MTGRRGMSGMITVSENVIPNNAIPNIVGHTSPEVSEDDDKDDNEIIDVIPTEPSRMITKMMTKKMITKVMIKKITNPEIIDVKPTVFEPARKKPNITLCLSHPQAVGLE